MISALISPCPKSVWPPFPAATRTQAEAEKAIWEVLRIANVIQEVSSRDAPDIVMKIADERSSESAAAGLTLMFLKGLQPVSDDGESSTD